MFKSFPINQVETGLRPGTKQNAPRRAFRAHTGGVTKEESEQKGAIPLIERHGLRTDKKKGD